MVENGQFQGAAFAFLLNGNVITFEIWNCSRKIILFFNEALYKRKEFSFVPARIYSVKQLFTALRNSLHLYQRYQIRISLLFFCNCSFYVQNIADVCSSCLFHFRSKNGEACSHYTLVFHFPSFPYFSMTRYKSYLYSL